MAVRYADTEHRRRFGYSGHGGLIEHGRVVHECMARLATVIAHNHGVTAAEIDDARASRNPWFDVPVMLSFAAIYVLAAASACGWIRRRFFDTSRVAGAIVAGAASLGCSALGLQFGAVWSAIWECVRIGDDHFGTFRAARPPWGQHLDGLYASGIVLFWIVAALAARRAIHGDMGLDPPPITHLR